MLLMVIDSYWGILDECWCRILKALSPEYYDFGSHLMSCYCYSLLLYSKQPFYWNAFSQRSPVALILHPAHSYLPFHMLLLTMVDYFTVGLRCRLLLDYRWARVLGTWYVASVDQFRILSCLLVHSGYRLYSFLTALFGCQCGFDEILRLL